MRRGAILDDGFAALRDAGSAIKGRLCVSFVSMHGELEAGLDYGGLVKEFLEEVILLSCRYSLCHLCGESVTPKSDALVKPKQALAYTASSSVCV